MFWRKFIYRSVTQNLSTSISQYSLVSTSPPIIRTLYLTCYAVIFLYSYHTHPLSNPLCYDFKNRPNFKAGALTEFEIQISFNMMYGWMVSVGRVMV